jgi:bifunctional DNase/RNase
MGPLRRDRQMAIRISQSEAEALQAAHGGEISEMTAEDLIAHDIIDEILAEERPNSGH